MVDLPVHENEDSELTSEQEDELAESIAEIARGEFISGHEMLEQLRRMREQQT